MSSLSWSVRVGAVILGALVAVHCGPDRTEPSFDARSDAREGGTDASLDARDATAMDVRPDVRPDVAQVDVRPDVRPEASTPADTGGGGTGECSTIRCSSDDECARACGTMSGGVYCCYRDPADAAANTCYFSTGSSCGGGTGPGPGSDGGGAEAGGDDGGGLDGFDLEAGLDFDAAGG